ncbi:MAG: preprotein translocase subunit SecE [Acidobacteriaceae bacterium]|nr:preprotein translocase subunit SecE [Acidobacteriaceae bacterium]
MAKTAAVAEQNPGLQQLKGYPERIKNFLHDVRSEMRKVIAPPRAEVRATTTVVIVTVFLFAAFFWAIDSLLDRALGLLFH